jgi:peptidoglycan/LPS O-acetylase OafA/YrhL
MIQRIQSIWLFLAAALNAVTFKFPFYAGDWLKDELPNTVVNLNAQTTIWNTTMTVVAGLLAMAAIFLFNNRKLQLRLTYLTTVVTLGLLTLYLIQTGQFANGTISLWCIFYFAVLLCLILAARGISKDEKLIKSMDRLR